MNADPKAPRNSLAPNNATIRHEEVETFETRSCITNITDCFVPLVSYVSSFCLLRFVSVLFDFRLPIYTLLSVSVAYPYSSFSFRSSTKHRSPFCERRGRHGGLRNAPSDKTDNAAAASSAPPKRRLYFRTRESHWLPPNRKRRDTPEKVFLG